MPVPFSTRMTGQKIPSVHLSVAVTSIWQNKAKANPILVHLNGSVEVCKQSQNGAGPWGTGAGAVGGHGALVAQQSLCILSAWVVLLGFCLGYLVTPKSAQECCSEVD